MKISESPFFWGKSTFRICVIFGLCVLKFAFHQHIHFRVFVVFFFFFSSTPSVSLLLGMVE